MRKRTRWVRLLPALLLAALLLLLLDYCGLLPHRTYTAEHFGIETLQSPHDEDGDGIDDYTDLMLGAREDAENRPTYDPGYFAGGYPPEDRGVCTDVIWRAFRHAGYDLKAMVDADIAANTERYWRVEGQPDPNIDFRRVPNLRVFFMRHAESLTSDPYDISAWQPGDIVTFEDRHIGRGDSVPHPQQRPVAAGGGRAAALSPQPPHFRPLPLYRPNRNQLRKRDDH